jgi:hypothetical protein
MDAAWRIRDHAGLNEALERAFDVDPAAARQWAFDTIMNGSHAQRAVGAGVLAELGEADALAAAARALPARGFHDERRWLIRGLAAKPPEQARPLARAFLSDREPVIRLAAAQTLAALADAGAVGELLPQMRGPPALRSTFDDSDAGLLSAAAFGLVHAATDLRPQREGDVQAWWSRHREAPDRAPGPRPAALLEGPPVTGRFQGRDVFFSPAFDVQLRVSGWAWPGTGELSWPEFRDLAEGTAADSIARARPIFGPMALPPVRLILADQRQFSALTSASWFGGQASGNQIVLRLDRPEVLRPVLTHEHVHVIHAMSFRRQPRWILEGVAESLTISGPERGVWTRARVERLGLENLLDRGVFTETLAWTSGPSSDSREAQRYAMSHLVVDYMRFGPFARGDERVAFLMGRLSRGEPSRQAVERLFERTVAELDEDVRDWVNAR